MRVVSRVKSVFLLLAFELYVFVTEADKLVFIIALSYEDYEKWQ